MYEAHYKLTRDPFRLRPRTEVCFQHASYAKALSYLFYAMEKGEGLLLVTGSPGTGKTTLIRDCVSQTSESPVQFLEISTGSIDGDDLIYLIANKLALPTDGTRKVAMLANIEKTLRRAVDEGQKTVLLIDEAQSLANEALDEVKNLANLEYRNSPLMQIFLVGQTSLKQQLRSPELSQVMQRITAACELKPMTKDDMMSYIEHCLRESGWSGLPKIASAIVPSLFLYTGGIPRRVNLICSRLLLRGMVQNQDRLEELDLEAVVQDLREEGLLLDISPMSVVPVPN